MAFNSGTKSWAQLNADQRRESIALAAFNKLNDLSSQANSFATSARRNLLLKIDGIKRKVESNIKLEEAEVALLALEEVIKSIGNDTKGVEKVEMIFPVMKKFLMVESIGRLGSKYVVEFLEKGELSKIVSAIDHFKFSGSSAKAPAGKSESDIGISDSVLNKLMEITGAASTLNYWMRLADERWKKYVDAAITVRKRELDSLKKSKSNPTRMHVLETEISKLERDWAL